MRDLYQEMLCGRFNSSLGTCTTNNPWDFACREWPQEILEGLTGETTDGKQCSLQNIDSMLDCAPDLGEYNRDEWRLFFERVREEGI